LRGASVFIVGLSDKTSNSIEEDLKDLL